MAGFQLRQGNPNIVEIPEHTTAGSFAIGDPVKVDSGKLKIASDDQDIFGIAMKAATGTAGTDIPVAVLTPEQIWSINADSATTPLTTMVGASYGLTISAGATVINLAGGTTAGHWILDSLDQRDTAAAGTRVCVRASYGVCDAIGG